VTRLYRLDDDQKRQSGTNLMEEFRTRYREYPDVLLVDDTPVPVEQGQLAG